MPTRGHPDFTLPFATSYVETILSVARAANANTTFTRTLAAADLTGTVMLVGTLLAYQAIEVEVRSPAGLIVHRYRHYARAQSQQMALAFPTIGGDVVIRERIPSAGANSTFTYSVLGIAGASPGAVQPPRFVGSQAFAAVAAGAACITDPNPPGGMGGTLTGWVGATGMCQIQLQHAELTPDWSTGQDSAWNNNLIALGGAGQTSIGANTIFSTSVAIRVANTGGAPINVEIYWVVHPASPAGAGGGVGIASI